MKIKPGFILKTVAGETVALPTQGTTNLDLMITLNDTGRFLWEKLAEDVQLEDLVAALLQEYEVDEATARAAVEDFVAKLKENDFLA